MCKAFCVSLTQFPTKNSLDREIAHARYVKYAYVNTQHLTASNNNATQ